MLKGLLFTSSLLLLAACGDKVHTETSPLVGTWITGACEQMSDANGTALDAWARGLYEFTRDGEIKVGAKHYADANCQSLQRTQVPEFMDYPFEFEDLGETVLQEGLDGRKLRVSFDTGVGTLTTDGFYLIDGDRLCLSEVFRFRASSVGISISRFTLIDFDNCLLRAS